MSTITNYVINSVINFIPEVEEENIMNIYDLNDDTMEILDAFYAHEEKIDDYLAGIEILNDLFEVGKHFGENIGEIVNWVRSSMPKMPKVNFVFNLQLFAEKEENATDNQITDPVAKNFPKKVYTSYFARVNFLKDKSNVYSIARTNPKDYKDIPRITALAPTRDILNKYKKDGDQKAYTEEFNKILKNVPLSIIPDGAILCCWEAPDKFCHRHLVGKWLASKGVDVHELNIEEIHAMNGVILNLFEFQNRERYETKLPNRNINCSVTSVNKEEKIMTDNQVTNSVVKNNDIKKDISESNKGGKTMSNDTQNIDATSDTAITSAVIFENSCEKNDITEDVFAALVNNFGNEVANKIKEEAGEKFGSFDYIEVKDNKIEVETWCAGAPEYWTFDMTGELLAIFSEEVGDFVYKKEEKTMKTLTTKEIKENVKKVKTAFTAKVEAAKLVLLKEKNILAEIRQQGKVDIANGQEKISSVTVKEEIKAAKAELRMIRAELAVARTAQQIKVAEANNKVAEIKLEMLKAVDAAEKVTEVEIEKPIPTPEENSVAPEFPEVPENTSEPETFEEVPEEISEPEVPEDKTENEVHEEISEDDLEENSEETSEPELVPNEEVQNAVKENDNTPKNTSDDSNVIAIADIKSDTSVSESLKKAKTLANPVISMSASVVDIQRVETVIVAAVRHYQLMNFKVVWDKENFDGEWANFVRKISTCGVEVISDTKPEKATHDTSYLDNFTSIFF